ncbi:uracil-DNA glycosylase [Prochlorococcus marinus]|uniref:Type-4 uracil-DNA glycosylase n=1 Tax=Prochlorococcus marinus (strain MIT 9211) TaxID=93059 RepID=A9BA58_PROM4|nr:Uracil-DNA glycosylase [Prochlorococcus marinus str. MIT 9211]
MSKSDLSQPNISEQLCNCLEPCSKVVVGRGNPSAHLMLVGEAPGAKEELLGKPFVGRSGKVLDNLLEVVGIDHQKDIYICNVMKSRPPNNRRPTRAEIAKHLPWLVHQIKLVKPFVIVLAGATALETFLEIKTKITVLRGTWQNWRGIAVMPIFHPSYLLRNPSNAKGSPLELTRSDLFEVRKRMETYQIL